MDQYISKSAVVAEIERLKSVFVNERDDFERGYHHSLNSFIYFLDTIEVKEVDLEKEIERFVKSKEFQKASGTIKVTNLLAKHFFELGLKAQKGE